MAGDQRVREDKECALFILPMYVKGVLGENGTSNLGVLEGSFPTCRMATGGLANHSWRKNMVGAHGICFAPLRPYHILSLLPGQLPRSAPGAALGAALSARLQWRS